MYKKIIFLFSLILLLVHLSIAQYPVKRKPGIYRVLARSGLNMRAEASLSGKTINKIPYGKEVQLIDEGYNMVKVGWMQGHWARINYEGQKGYVYGPYITHLPLPELKLDANACDSDIYGFEFLLYGYIDQFLEKEGPKRMIYETPPYVEEQHRSVESQWYEGNIQVLKTIFYESGSTALRVPGMDIYQAFAFLETLLKACTEAGATLKNPQFIKDQEGKVIEIRDAEYDGYNFRIRQIDAVTAEIQMSSGV